MSESNVRSPSSSGRFRSPISGRESCLSSSRARSRTMVRTPLSAVTIYAVVSIEIAKVVEFFRERDEARAFIAKVAADEPEHAARLRVTSFEYSFSSN